MQLKLNRPIAILLLILLAPSVIPLRLYRWIAGTDVTPQYISSVEGDPTNYGGDKPIIIAVWAKSATLWKTITGELVTKLRAEYGDRCEFAYVEVTIQNQMRELGLDVVPTVILRHNGKDVDRFPNMMNSEQLKTAIEKVLGSSNTSSAD